MRDAAALCVDLGRDLVEAAPEINGELVTQAFMALWSAGCVWIIDGIGLVTGRTPNQDQFEPLTWALYEMGRQQSASSYLLSLTFLQRVARDLAGFFLKYDVWSATPPASRPCRFLFTGMLKDFPWVSNLLGDLGTKPSFFDWQLSLSRPGHGLAAGQRYRYETVVRSSRGGKRSAIR